MNHLIQFVPLLAVAFGQFDASETKLSVYGPMGIICLWLMWRDEKTRKESSKVHEAVREDNGKLREEFRAITHQMKGLNRNLLYVTATHGSPGLKEVAQRELERIEG